MFRRIASGQIVEKISFFSEFQTIFSPKNQTAAELMSIWLFLSVLHADTKNIKLSAIARFEELKNSTRFSLLTDVLKILSDNYAFNAVRRVRQPTPEFCIIFHNYAEFFN